MNREDLENAVDDAFYIWTKAKNALADWNSMAEHNAYDSIEAAGALEDTLMERALKDCEGAHNCGDDSYSQDFVLDGVKYRATLTCEYNRYDKMYYYVDGHTFSISPID